MRSYPIPIILVILLYWGCTGNPTTLDDIQEYQGPVLEVDSGITIYSDSAIIKIKMYANKQLEFENGDREFPDGIFIEFFEEGLITSTLKANIGYYKKDEDKYTALGDVVVNNIKEKQKLNTEELNWTPKDKKIFTDKFVRIESESEILTGEGLIANQDLSSYEILKPKGDFTIPEENINDNTNTSSETFK
jgi:lipopolysaccharide export system protein LptC